MMLQSQNQIRKSSKSRHAIRITKKKTLTLKEEINQYFDENGYLSYSTKKKKYVILGTNSPKDGLLECPECHVGQLMVIRSYKTKKRFMGCSNYYNGCKASSPLLQKAMLKATKIPCKFCSWPTIIFRYSRKEKWVKRCANFNCSGKKKV